MNDFEKKLIEYFSLSEDELNSFLYPLEKISLLDPNKIEGMDKAKKRIFDAIENKEKIIIYGDYDCDGISATSIMVKTFQLLNYPVSYYIPSRYIDGYGLNVSNVKKIAEKGFKLIITVDNGISADEAIDEANKNDIDVIVVDHHELPEKAVNAHAILHPIYSHISSIVASGGYMSLFLSAALLGRYDDYLVTIAGLSVISDMMELKGYNRDVVRLAVSNLEKHRYLPLRLLTDSSLISEKSFSLEIAPKINAIGRMKEDTSVNKLVKYLTSSDENEICSLNEFIKEINEERKLKTKETVDALEVDASKEKGIVLLLDTKEGLAGLIANRIMNQYNLPTVIFVSDEKNPTILKGSARSKNGFNIVKAFSSLDKYLLTGGGHALAGGLSIKKEDFPSFKKEFLDLCERYPLIKEEKKVIDISISDINFENYSLLRKYAPFGMGNEEPTFRIEHLPTRSLQFISFGKHLSTPLSIRSKLLGFNMNEKDVKANPFIDIYGRFELSSFRDALTLEFRISDFITK